MFTPSHLSPPWPTETYLLEKPLKPHSHDAQIAVSDSLDLSKFRIIKTVSQRLYELARGGNYEPQATLFSPVIDKSQNIKGLGFEKTRTWLGSCYCSDNLIRWSHSSPVDHNREEYRKIQIYFVSVNLKLLSI